MSPPRRRSARIASTQRTPKAVSGLLSVTEDTEPSMILSPRRLVPKSPKTAPSTPPSSAIKPPHSEMHPSKVHQSTGEPSSAVALGFIDIDAPERRKSGFIGTPSRTTGLHTASFTFDLGASTDRTSLSNDAKRILEELQEKAAKIKVDLVAQREAEGIQSDLIGDRRFAKPKSRANRFSAAHTAEFDKMESIEGHASAWRASRFTPVIAGIKRSPSKASLDESPSRSTIAVPQQNHTVYDHVSQTPKKNLKRKSSAANLDGRPGVDSPKKSSVSITPNKAQTTIPSKAVERTPVERQAVKRLKQRKEDDTSTNKPQSATSSIASGAATRPQSTLSRLMSPTKSSRMHKTTSPTKQTTSVSTPKKAAVSPRKPTISLVTTPSKPTTSPIRAAAASTPGFAQSLTAGSLTSKADGLARRILSPTRIQRVKSILRSQPTGDVLSASAIPQPALYGSHTPAPQRLDKDLPPIPFTTPSRKLTKKVTFTPETKRAAAEQGSPSPLKSSLFKFRNGHGSKAIRDLEMKNAASENGGHVAYPDLSAFKELIDQKDDSDLKRIPSVPSSFTFRSDHTIAFGEAPRTGFGSSIGQSSIRHVRESDNQVHSLPGSFPAAPAPSTHPDKENSAPASVSKALPGVLHGLTSKKRNRPSSDEEDAEREAAERAAKKRKNTLSGAERPALSSAKAIISTPQSNVKRTRLDRNTSLTPSRQLNNTSASAPGSASPTKKRPGMSMSRLNMLAQPKARA